MKKLGFLVIFGFFLSSAENGLEAHEETPEEKALARGLDFLKRTQQPDGFWPHPEKVGMTALAGLTLLECSMAQDDPAIEKAAQGVRQGGIALCHTYSLALAIMFLDRLGHPGDAPLIECMGLRLLAGQNVYGGWGYYCPGPNFQEVARLTKIVVQTGKQKPPRQPPENFPKLSKEGQGQFKQLESRPPQFLDGSLGDTSNTLFATMGLATAKKYGLPAEKSLASVETRLLKSQLPDGGWSYLPAVHEMIPGNEKMTSKIEFEEKKVKQTEIIYIQYRIEQEIINALYASGLGPFMAQYRLPQVKEKFPKTIAVLHGWSRSPQINPKTMYYPSMGNLNFKLSMLGTNLHHLININWACLPSEHEKAYGYFRGQKYAILGAMDYPNGVREATYGKPYPFVINEVRPLTPCFKPFPPLDVKNVVPGVWVPAEFYIKYDLRIIPIFQQKSVTKIAPKITANAIANHPGRIQIPSQGEFGTMAPTWRSVGSTPALTADALLSLGLCQSANPVGKNPADKKMEFLNHLRKSALEKGFNGLISNPAFPFGQAVKVPPRTNFYYFLWALGQTAQVFGLDNLAGKDIYSWGKDLLLANQKPVGSWQGTFGPGPDTCFALLFLQKAKMVPDAAGRFNDTLNLPQNFPDPVKKFQEVIGEKEAGWLCQTLARSNPGQQELVLKKFRDKPGQAATAALALAIPLAPEKTQNKIRLALAQRLTRSNSQEIRDLLEDDNSEIRRAAVNACVFQKSKSHIPFLIPLLLDEDAPVARAAHIALKRLSEKDVGPKVLVSYSERQESVTAWKAWWEKQNP